MSKKSKVAAQVLKSIIAERGIVEVHLPQSQLINKRRFFFSNHAQRRMWERLGVREVNLSEVKIIKAHILKLNGINLPKGWFCFGKENFALVCRQQAPNKFQVVTVYKINQ